MKHILLYIFAFAGLTLQAQNPLFLLPSGLQTTVGETIEADLSVDTDISPYDVYAYEFTFTYDANRLKIVSVQFDDKLQDFTNVANTQQAGKVTLTGASLNKAEGSARLVTIVFEALASGNAPLNFIPAECVLNEGLPAASYQNGSIRIANKPVITLSPNTRFMAVGQTVQCTVSGNGTPPYTWGVTNPDVATISESGLLTAVGHGRTKVFVEDALALRDTTDGFYDITAIRLYFPSGLQEWQEWEVNIPVKTTDFSSVNVLSGQLSLTYRADVLQFVGTDAAGTLLENSSVSAGEIQSGKMNLTFASTQPLGAASDELIRLRFKVLPNATATSALTFSDVVFNEDISAFTENGSFVPKILPVLGITPASATLVAGDSLQFTVSNGNEPYTWSVSNERVASVRQNGWLIANEGGEVDLTVTDAVGAVKTISGIQVSDMRMYFPVDTLESVNDITLTRCLVDSVPAGRQAVSSVEGEISVSNTNIKVLDIETEGTFAEGWQKIITQVSDQRIKFYLAGSTPFRDKGIAFYVKSELMPAFKEYDRCDFRFHNVLVNEGVPNPVFIDGSLEGKLFTDQDKTICLGESTGEIVARETKDKTISKWQKRIRIVGQNPAWTDIANTDSVYSDTPDALGEWEYRAVIDGVPTKVANILVKTISDVSGAIQGESLLCHFPATYRYYAERRPTAEEYRWHYRGEGAVLHPNENMLDLEITDNITPGYLVMYTANACGQSVDSLVLQLSVYNQTEEIVVCSGSDYIFPDGHMEANIVSDMKHISKFQTINGCDSVITTSVSVTTVDVSVRQENSVLTANQADASYQWLDCDDGNTPIEGATQQSFSPVKNGNYAVEISWKNCSATSSCYEVIITSVPDYFPGKDIRVYPNPVKDKLQIDFNNEAQFVRLSINDVSGRMVYASEHNNEQQLIVDVSAFPAGIYFVTLATKEKNTAFRIVKQ